MSTRAAARAMRCRHQHQAISGNRATTPINLEQHIGASDCSCGVPGDCAGDPDWMGSVAPSDHKIRRRSAGVAPMAGGRDPDSAIRIE